jgi:hypothetical protein
MSLFKTREWWSLDLSSPEVFSPDCFRLAKFKKLTGRDTDLVLTGSLSGNIRIFNPYPVPNETSDQSSGPENLILETNLGKPILQISTGRLSRFNYPVLKWRNHACGNTIITCQQGSAGLY